MRKKITQDEKETRLDIYLEVLEFLQGPNWEEKKEDKQAAIVYKEILKLYNRFKDKPV